MLHEYPLTAIRCETAKPARPRETANLILEGGGLIPTITCFDLDVVMMSNRETDGG
jgi:hypothetical protein